MTTIQPSTKISELIQIDKRAIEAIALLSKPLEKLRNPLLRKLMASKVSISEASHMGKISLEDFKKALLPLDIELDLTKVDSPSTNEKKPAWLETMPPKELTTFNVVPIIDQGSDPLKQIMAEWKKINPGEVLCIVNTFLPTPLINLLKENQAKDVYSFQDKHDSLFYSYFLKKPKEELSEKKSEDKTKATELSLHSEESFKSLVSSYPSSKIKTLDVRHLEMPLPMQTILQELGTLEKEQVLFVHHKRIPYYLLEELRDSKFQIEAWVKSDEEVELLFK